MYSTDIGQKTRPTSPEPEEEGNDHLAHPPSKREQWMIANQESLQSVGQEPEVNTGQGMRRGLLIVLAMLAGLMLLAAIESDLRERLAGFVFPDSAVTTSPASLAAEQPDDGGRDTGSKSLAAQREPLATEAGSLQKVP